MAYSARVLLDSISEMGVRLTTLEVTFPRFILPEFNTHRTFCLDGDTKLYFDLPTRKGSTKRFTMSLRECYGKWHHGAAVRRNHARVKNADGIDPERLYTAHELAVAAGYADYRGIDLLTRRCRIPRVVTPGQRYRVRGADFLNWRLSEGSNRQPMRWRMEKMQLRSCNEETGEIYHTNIADVCYSGKKDTYRVTLANGQQIVSSAEHLFLTENGWERLRDAVDLRLSETGIASWSKPMRLAVNGIPAYRDPEWLQAQRDKGLSARAISEIAGASVDTIKGAFRRYDIRCTNPRAVWRTAHTKPPWNKGRRYCNILTRGVPRNARVKRGAESHLWRGGISPERKLIGAWTVNAAFRVHKRNGFRCVLCDGARDLHAHHLDPVAHNPLRAYDEANLVTICGNCHRELHGRNLELLLLDYTEMARAFSDFWSLVGFRKLQRPFARKQKRTMVRHFVDVKSIEYVGVRDTYDVEVAGPYHNFVADGFIVHNSRNSASSRAVPTSKLIDRALNDPAVPSEWGRNKAGMSADVNLAEEDAERAKAIWLEARDHAVETARKLQTLNVHKQILNRILEPFLWHTVIVTATDWRNFFDLRCAPNAQPEIRQAAIAMRTAIEESVPKLVQMGEWHLPLVQEDEHAMDIEMRKKLAAARCARVSYLTHDGTRDPAKDIELYDRLKADRHLSPFEHVATPANDVDFHANFRGWVQQRAGIERGSQPVN